MSGGGGHSVGTSRKGVIQVDAMVQSSGYPAPGEVIDGKYRIDKMLGQGGMGAVAGAFHLLRKAPVALKFISPDIVRVPGAVERFVNEAVAASQIDSDHVVRIFDVGQMPSGLTDSRW